MSASESARDRAAQLAAQLDLPLIDCGQRYSVLRVPPTASSRARLGKKDDEESSAFDFLLAVTDDRLELREPQHRVAPLFVDFVAGATAHRRKSGQSRKQPLARAIGIKGAGCTVLDATAGLGRDAFLLACLGCTVTGVERSPILCALLADGLRRATESLDPSLQAIIGRLHFVHADARTYLMEDSKIAPPEVVYLDPMFPSRNKSALEGREIRVCRALVGADDDADELLHVARRVARRRVVVKRHRHAPPLDRPDFEITGRTVRYDVYMTNG